MFRTLALLAAMVITCATGAFAAEAQTQITPKISSFDFLVDYSGSMAMKHTQAEKVKMTMAKTIIGEINSKIPALGYQGGLQTFAPNQVIIPVSPWNNDDFAKGIAEIQDDYPIYGRLTPMGTDFTSVVPSIATMPRKAAVILVSDGASNIGSNPISAAKAIANLKDVCLHVISLADTAEGQKTLDAIAAQSPCSISVRGTDLLASPAALDAFVRDVFYDEQTIAPQMEDVIVLRNVNFAFNSYKLDQSAMEILDQVGTIIQTHPDKKVLITGHTDSTGPAAYNMTLSKERADAVRNYLVQMGIAADRFKTVGDGEAHPKYTNDTAEGRSLNRRVEISFI